jgi:hypothetical protein
MPMPKIFPRRRQGNFMDLEMDTLGEGNTSHGSVVFEVRDGIEMVPGTVHLVDSKLGVFSDRSVPRTVSVRRAELIDIVHSAGNLESEASNRSRRGRRRRPYTSAFE